LCENIFWHVLYLVINNIVCKWGLCAIFYLSPSATHQRGTCCIAETVTLGQQYNAGATNCKHLSSTTVHAIAESRLHKKDLPAKTLTNIISEISEIRKSPQQSRVQQSKNCWEQCSLRGMSDDIVTTIRRRVLYVVSIETF
jgi:hypothetical protein